MRILLVEDNPKLSESIKTLLQHHSLVSDIAATLAIANAAIQDYIYDLVILDRMLPDGDGLEVMKLCQKKKIITRFIILSALGQTHEKVKGLNLGADDYVSKTCEPEEFIARVKSSLRRPLMDNNKYTHIGNLVMHTDTMNFSISGAEFIPRRNEALVLEVLMQKPGKVVRRKFLEMAIYGYDQVIASNTMESHISRLRKALNLAGADVHIKTIRGVGYALVKI